MVEDALECINLTASARWSSPEDQRPFYDWLLDRLAEGGLIATPKPRQYEFARLNLTYVGKRKLSTWWTTASWLTTPRMPTIGLR